MKLIFALLAMAAAAAADDAYAGDDADGGYNDYAGDDAYANANAKQSWGSWFDHTSTNVATSIRDSNFYRSGFVNPALTNPLYHSSAKSVLSSLGDFDALYVKYENCAWAQYGQEYAEHRDDHNDENGYYSGEQILGCGGGRGGDEYWYMGSTACFRAQAAFSLYGIPKGHSHRSGSSAGSKCHKATYINSFFTTMGVEALASPLSVDTTYGNSYCTVYTPSDGNEAYKDDDANDDGPGHVTKYDFADYTSSGMACKNHRFVTDTFGGAFCDGNDYIKTTDTLDSFNRALENLDCVQIYDSSSGYYYDNHDDDEEDHHDDNQNAVDFAALDNSVEILKYSIACDVDQYPRSCPDPHGLLRKYSAKLQSALSKAEMLSKSPGEIAMNALTGVLFFLSLLLGAAIIRKRRRLASKDSMKKDRKSTSPPSSADNVSVISSSTSSSGASSDRSIAKDGSEVDEETPYQAHEVTKQPSYVVSVVTSLVSYLPGAPTDDNENDDKSAEDSTVSSSGNDGAEVEEETPYQAHDVTTSTDGSAAKVAPKTPRKRMPKIISGWVWKPKKSQKSQTLATTGTY